MSNFVEVLGFGIATGILVVIAALGFTMQFGLTNIINIAYGGFLTVGAYLALGFLKLIGNIWVTMLVVALILGVASVVYNRLLLTPLKRRGTGITAMVIVTVSAGICLEYLLLAIVGPNAQSLQVGESTVRIWLFTLTSIQLALIVLGAAVMLLAHVVLTYTQVGRAIRATANNEMLAKSVGIRTQRVTDLVWLGTGALSGVAGVGLAMTAGTYDFTIGSTFLIYAISAAVLGGIGSPYGAMAGGLIIGITTQMTSAYWNPAYENVGAFVFLVAILLFRPSGIFRRAAQPHGGQMV